MTKRKSTRSIALLIALVLITSLFIGISVARYVTSTSSEDEARVAIWGINEAGTTMDLFQNEYKLEDDTLVAKSNDGDNIIAPGLNGASQFKIVEANANLKPEVMYEVKISLDDTEIANEIKNHPGIQWKVDNGNWVTWDEFKKELLLLSGDASGVKTYAPGTVAPEFANGKRHTVAWQWVMDSGYDIEDTAMGNLAATGQDITAKLVITVTARQVDTAIDLIHNDIIPKNGVYYQNVDSNSMLLLGDYTGATIYTEGNQFPTIKTGDVYVYGDYEYRYNMYYDSHEWLESPHSDGWSVAVLNKEKTTYSPLLETINGKNLVELMYAFKNCTELETSPTIPNTVISINHTFENCTSLQTVTNLPSSLESMAGTFANCTSLVNVPNIPITVLNLTGTFNNCTSLTTIATIPENVGGLHSTFANCTNLTGTIEINANPIEYTNMFKNTTKPIYITGSSSKLEAIAAEYDNVTII